VRILKEQGFKTLKPLSVEERAADFVNSHVKKVEAFLALQDECKGPIYHNTAPTNSKAERNTEHLYYEPHTKEQLAQYFENLKKNREHYGKAVLNTFQKYSQSVFNERSESKAKEAGIGGR
jgi:hypothetical protein